MLSAVNCTEVTFTWQDSRSLQYSLYYYIIRVVSLDANTSRQVRVPINETSRTLTLDCGVSYVSFITAYLLTTPGQDSKVVRFNTGLLRRDSVSCQNITHIYNAILG